MKRVCINIVRKAFVKKRAKLQKELDEFDDIFVATILSMEAQQDDVTFEVEDKSLLFTEEIPGSACSCRYCIRSEEHERHGPVSDVRAFRLDTSLRVCDLCYEARGAESIFKEFFEKSKIKNNP